MMVLAMSQASHSVRNTCSRSGPSADALSVLLGACARLSAIAGILGAPARQPNQQSE
jgi:hypothetical protein